MTLIDPLPDRREARRPHRLALAALALLAVFVSSFLVHAPGANADDGIQLSITSIDDSAFPTIRITLSAEQNGLPIASTTGSALQVQEDGKPVAVQSVQEATAADQPLALVIAVDTSGSMEGPSLTSVQQAATALIQSLDASDSAAVISFADRVQVDQPLTTDRAALESSVSKLVAGGNTALYDAVAQSTQMAANSGQARRAVILITDGQDFGGASHLSREQSLADVKTGGALFYVIGVGSQIDQQYLQDVATQSGGKFFAAPTAAEIGTIYDSLEQLLRSQLVVVLKSAAPAAAGEHTISVTLTEGGASGIAQRSYVSTAPALPTAVAPTAAPATIQAPLPKAASAPQRSSGGVPGWLVGVIGLGVAAAGVALIMLARRRSNRHARTWRPNTEQLADQQVPTTSPLGMAEPMVRGARFVVNAPALGASTLLGDAPILIGSGERCDLRLPADPQIAEEHARIWLRDGRPMLHHVAARFETSVNNVPTTWASIDEDDAIMIGPYRIECVERSGSNARTMPQHAASWTT